MYDNHDNEYKTKENKNWTKDKIEPQHIQNDFCSLQKSGVMCKLK